ncbi:MAG: glycoside hydrolase family 31 protein [Polyangiaceae bacterium]
MRNLRLGLAPLLVVLACGDDTSGPVEPVDLGLPGGFTGTIADGDRLVIQAADGRTLLDGLAPDAVAPDGAPLVGFATRTFTSTYEMQYGAFKPTITADGQWRVARHLVPSDGGLQLLDEAYREIASLTFSSPEDGHLVVDLEPGPGAALDPEHPETRTAISWGFACDPSDHFAGFGAQSWDADHRGQTVPTFVTEGGVGKSETDDYIGLWMLQGQRHSSHAPIPEYLSSRGYIFVAESDRRSTFALCSESDSAARVQIDLPAKVHVFDGPTPREAVARASATFGRPRMPPKVAFAPWLDAIFGSENVRAIANELRDDGIPGSVIWTEDWRGGDWSNENYALKEEWEVDRTLYPDIEQVADDLHALGFDFHVYFNPFIYEGSKAWDETEPNGWLVKTAAGDTYKFVGAKFTETGLIDLDNPDARAWAVSKMQAAIDLGADGWMNDFAEWLPTDGVTAAGLSYEAHNRYPVGWQEVARAAIDGRAGDGVERLFFGRSAWFGSAPLVDVFWAGDQRTTFDRDDGMPTLLPMAIGLGIVGLSTYGHDIAGYQSATNPGSTKELYFRWTSLGAWSPVMRTHHGAQPNKEWSWRSDVETTAHFKRYAELHMALVPTMMGLAREATNTGMPMWRGLALEFPSDAAVWPITDEVLLGANLLLAPVMTAGATSRSVYFPEGRWFPWDGGAPIEGPATTDIDSPVSEIPVFARAGALVPMYPPGVETLVRGSAAIPDASTVGDDRIVYVFLGADGAFTEDGGLSYTLTSSADVSGAVDLSYQPDGGAAVTLAACDMPVVAPCLEESAGVTTAYVTGPGALTLSKSGTQVAELVVAGGAANRALTLRVLR